MRLPTPSPDKLDAIIPCLAAIGLFVMLLLPAVQL